MKKTIYKIKSDSFKKKLSFAVVSDLHGSMPDCVISALYKEKPDYILMPGDIFERLDGADDKIHDNAFKLIKASTEIAPTFYSTGNHEDGSVGSWNPFRNIPTSERNYSDKDIKLICDRGVTLLDDTFVVRNGIAFGGLSSGLIRESKKPNVEWLDKFCSTDTPRVLLCHHPEYYEPYLKKFPIDLIVSGHAHGGQWRFFGRGVFAPGQGVFPKYCSGIHDGRFVISTGLKPSGIIPRIFNEPEIVFIHVQPE